MSPDAPAGTQPEPLTQEPAPDGWLIAGAGEILHVALWVGDIYRTSEEAAAELAAARDEGREGLQVYALYACPEVEL